MKEKAAERRQQRVERSWKVDLREASLSAVGLLRNAAGSVRVQPVRAEQGAARWKESASVFPRKGT